MPPCQICERGGLDNHCFGAGDCGCTCAVFASNLAASINNVQVTRYEREPGWGEAANGIAV